MFLSLIVFLLCVSAGLCMMSYVRPVLITVQPHRVTKFERDSSMDDHNCADDITFAADNVPSLAACLQICRNSGNSLIYNELSTHCQCHGSSNAVTLNCVSVDNSGNRFYILDAVSFVDVKAQAKTTAPQMAGTTSRLTTSVHTTSKGTTVTTSPTGGIGVAIVGRIGVAIATSTLTTRQTTTNSAVTTQTQTTSAASSSPTTTQTTTSATTTQTTTNAITTQAATSATTTQTTTSATTTQTTTGVAVTVSPDVWLFRLVNGTATSGRLEVYNNGVWGVVYGFSFSVIDATIICRDVLDISTYGFPIYGDYFGIPTITEGLSKDYATEYNLLCYSNATCNASSWKSEGDTDFDEFAEFGTVGLDCTNKPLAVQLADGANSSSGRLEVKLLGTWGTVCGEGGYWVDGPLYCRYFGLNYTTFELAGNETTTTSGPVWIHGGLHNCLGNETNPADCEWSPFTKANFNQSCTHESDVILYCQ